MPPKIFFFKMAHDKVFGIRCNYSKLLVTTHEDINITLILQGAGDLVLAPSEKRMVLYYRNSRDVDIDTSAKNISAVEMCLLCNLSVAM
jgi:hypothetical protein